MNKLIKKQQELIDLLMNLIDDGQPKTTVAFRKKALRLLREIGREQIALLKN